MKRIICAVVGFEALLAVLLFFSAPSGMRWLGDTMQNSSDVAVYLSYLTQGASGRTLLKNLFAVESHAARFDLIWSSLGVIARSGIPPVVIHEAARWAFSAILVLAIYFAAREITAKEKDARLATLLAIGGVGAGWLYSVWLGSLGLWTPDTYAAADVVTEFSVAPTLLGGAHMILSMALLITGLRKLWDDRVTPALLIAWSILLAFHPYFVPFYILATILAIGWRKKLVIGHWFLVIPLLPAALIYAPLAFDPVFRTHHLVVNDLPLAPLASWFATLLPFALALAWRVKKRIAISPRERWLVAWIVSALACLLLPIPWKRKYTEGLGVALVFLTLPAWLAARDWAIAERSRLAKVATGSALFLAAFFTPLHLLASHLAWIGDPARQKWFYQPTAVFEAWTFLRNASTSRVILSDDRWVNIWTPAYSGRTVWVAHDHETPDYLRKRDAWKRLVATEDATEARNILDDAGVTEFIATSAASRERFARLTGWKIVFEKDDVAVFAR